MDFKIIYNDIFQWDGHGGKFKLASGNCNLLILDLRVSENVIHFKPYIIIAWDTLAKAHEKAAQKLTIRSCTSHIATQITEKFNINPKQMLFVEYNPPSTYGQQNEKVIKERFDSIECSWKDGKAFLANILNCLRK